MPDAGRQEALSRLLRPRSVAILGASPSPGSLGGGVVANLERFGFPGGIHLVHPTRADVNGRPCVPSVADLPDGVDCAVLAIPQAGVLDAVRACAARSIRSLIIFSGGFAEMGEAGRQAQDALARLADAHGLTIAGPNCLGTVNYVDNVALTFGVATPFPLRAGRGVGIVSQSGAMASVLRSALHARDIGISHSVSTGNEAVTSIVDFVDFLLDDPATVLLALVAEQFRQPGRFLALAARARAAGKPILLLHPGRSTAARQSAQTHTGALTGDYAVMRTLVEHEGVVLVETLETLIDLAELHLRCPLPVAGGVAVLTDSGAFKGMALDYGEAIGLPLPPLSAAAETAIRAAAPSFLAASNPLDLTAQALVDPGLYRRMLAPILADPAYGAVVLNVILSSEATARRKMPPILDAIREIAPDKPVIFGMLGDETPIPAEFPAELRALGVPFFRSPERAFRALARFLPSPRPGSAPPVPPAGHRLPAGTIPEYRAKAILAPLGLPVPRSGLAASVEDALRLAAEIGGPVALKAQAAALAHKTDAGGVVLRLADAGAVARGWAALHADLARTRPGLVLDGVLVEAMAAPGLELILGARTDPDWGPVLLVGMGGVWTEVLHDVRLLPANLDRAGVIREVFALKGAPLLKGYRGAPPLDVEAVADIVLALGRFVRAHAEIAEIDVNPLLVYPAGQGAAVVDALIVAR